MELLSVTCCSASILLDPDGDYYAREAADLFLNGEKLRREERSVFDLTGLMPDTEYLLTAVYPDREDRFAFRTEKETCKLDVRRFGAVGDGAHDDTAALQAAIACCPDFGRVCVPPGVYLTGPLFLKSRITLEIREGAVLSLITDRDAFPVLPGVTFTGDGEYLLGSFEGNPLDSYASALTGIGLEKVRVVGGGTVDGRANEGDWWVEPKKRRGAWRGHLLYLKDCSDVLVEGITFRNSPCWNLHPAFSEDLRFLCVRVQAPANSPNTDGFDPQSCRKVRLLGTLFTVGDDCIAIKSGKIYMANTRHTPTRHVRIQNCLMEDGHGGVTIGSEMAGGVYDVEVEHCLMRYTDRGLRIKTRRGRGKEGVIDGIVFRDIRMEHVRTPLCCNAMYYCDPDGHTPYVQTREKLPVDDRTPRIGTLTFERVTAVDAEACAGYFLGIPEMPCDRVELDSCSFAFASDAKGMVPVMAEGVKEYRRRGLILENVREAVIKNTSFEGIEGPDVETVNVENVIRETE